MAELGWDSGLQSLEVNAQKCGWLKCRSSERLEPLTIQLQTRETSRQIRHCFYWTSQERSGVREDYCYLRFADRLIFAVQKMAAYRLSMQELKFQKATCTLVVEGFWLYVVGKPTEVEINMST